jgi:cyclic dehypoxanthinyl futalosine synthase
MKRRRRVRGYSRSGKSAKHFTAAVKRLQSADMTDRPDQFDPIAVAQGEARLSIEQALWLYRHAPLHDLAAWSAMAAERIHGPRVRTYVIDRNINYTNICSARCTFCAFRRDGHEPDAYVLARDELHEKVDELARIGGTQVLLQGGMHPDLPLEFYEQMLRDLKAAFPDIHLHAFSPPEFVEFVGVCELEGFPVTAPRRSHTLEPAVWQAKLQAIMRRLVDAGLDSIPGGGAEILPMHVRRRIGSTKATAGQWLDVMRCAHRLGMFTSATMMFGHIEGVADRFMHMGLIRDAQDQAIGEGWPGRYVSFIGWPFQPDNTPLGRVPLWDDASGEPFAGDQLAEAVLAGQVDGHDAAACRKASGAAGRQLRLAGATDYLRTQAIARLFLDNVHSIGASWVTMGPKIGQIALHYGANDMGSVMMEENVVSAAGTTYCLNEPMICRLIRDAGFVPAQRDNRYALLKTHEKNGPDAQVTNWAAHRPASSAFGSSVSNESPTIGLTVGEQ